MAETNNAQVIASQVLKLKDTEVLLLRIPSDMSTGGKAFQNFAAELRSILHRRDVIDRVVRCIVITEGMDVELLSSGDLAKVGLRASAKHPGKSPEQLFSSGPLREAARAGWESANGNVGESVVCAVTAEASLKEEIRLSKKLDITAG